jgi:hypothetical protein
MAFNALEALQAFGAGRQMALQDREMQRAEETRARQASGRQLVGQQIRAGDFVGAAGTAFDFQLGDDVLQSVQRLNQAQQGQALREASTGLSVAQALRQAPMEQRGALAQRFAPTLQQAGFSPQEVSELAADLSDGALDGHIRYTQGLLGTLQTRTGSAQRPYRWKDNAGNVMELGPDGRPRMVYDDPNQRLSFQPDGMGGGSWVAQPDLSSGAGAPAALPDQLTDDEIEALEEGGPGQAAPATFPANEFTDPGTAGGWGR